MSQEPTYLTQTVNFLGFLAQQLGDLRGITALAHELIQNADDAKDELGDFSATQISFDIRDDSLTVSNNARFRDIDFERIRNVASGAKRNESGARTTGAFGVGFISVYQVTDSPEIRSTGKHWTIRPEREESKRIEQRYDPSLTKEKGTQIRLPWALEDSRVRRELKSPPVNQEDLDAYLEELKNSFPRAILFLKNLETIELRRNGHLVSQVRKEVDEDCILVDWKTDRQMWQIFEGRFSEKSSILKSRNQAIIDDNRSDRVRLAISESVRDQGLLFANLPTEKSTDLPFHIDADFFPNSDRKSIVFGDAYDPRSEWNRTALLTAAHILVDNLIPLRNWFGEDAAGYWAVLNSLFLIHNNESHDQGMPLHSFWDSLSPRLGGAPIVLSQRGQWLSPDQIRIPTGEKEQQACLAFRALGIEVVHQSLWQYRNVLTKKDVGVKGFSVKDIHDALKSRGLVKKPQPPPDNLQSSTVAQQLWQGVFSIYNNTAPKQREQAKPLLWECSLAPGTDGRWWPCRSAYLADRETYETFSALIPDNVTFLAVEEILFFQDFCPHFSLKTAIRTLEESDAEDLQSIWERRELDPSRLLSWFESRKSELTEFLRNRLARLPIFPSENRLQSLDDVWLPGGYQDLLGVAELMSSSFIVELGDFLRSLGAKELTFEEYANRHVADAFAKESKVSIEIKYRLLEILEGRFGEINRNQGLRTRLADTNIIECSDGTFRKPSETYFRKREVENVLGAHVWYAKGRTVLNRWLGVESLPRVADVVRVIELTVSAPPGQDARLDMQKKLEALAEVWRLLNAEEQNQLGLLRQKDWIPAEQDTNKWYKPTVLYDTINKELFQSQVIFIDIGDIPRVRIEDLLNFLEVKISPEPHHVVEHLIWSARNRKAPPLGIYDWLNKNCVKEDLVPLRNEACLWANGNYRLPLHTFWKEHQFGRFRVQLGPDLQSYRNLLQALEIRETPEAADAVEVLKEMSRDATGPLFPEDAEVVLQCWLVLSKAFQRGSLSNIELSSMLGETPCISNDKGLLMRPSWMFFEDLPGLLEKFPNQLRGNCIQRTEKVWEAMAAAGVRLLSTAVRGRVAEQISHREDQELKRRLAERQRLLAAILVGLNTRFPEENGVQQNEIGLFSTEKLTVSWELTAFGIRESTPPEPAQAIFDNEEMAIYFSKESDGSYPWSAIARELAFAYAPSVMMAAISPGLRLILEAPMFHDASRELKELGIPLAGDLGILSGQGDIVESLDRDYSNEILNESPQGIGIGNVVQGAISENLLPNTIDVVDTQAVEQSFRTSSTKEEDSPTYQFIREVNSSDLIAGELSKQNGTGERSEVSFAQEFYGVQTIESSRAVPRSILLPEGGPKTDESVRTNTSRSIQIGRMGSDVNRFSNRWEPCEASKEQAVEFKKMVHGDYGGRCQICSKTFAIPRGQFQVFVVHIVRPSTDHRTNHLGNLLGLCGWHYALIRYGEWALLNPETRQPFRNSIDVEGWELMRLSMSKASYEQDTFGNSFVGLPIRFFNIYQDWESEPKTVDDVIRYGIPHWKYLCKLMQS